MKQTHPTLRRRSPDEKWSRADGVGKAQSVPRKSGEDTLHLAQLVKALSGAGDNDPKFVLLLETALKS